MSSVAATPAKDDPLTLISISALGYIVPDILHEGLGHGVTAWLSGARTLSISTVALQSDIGTRWISANGTLVNLVTAAILWMLLHKPQRYSPQLHYFLALALAASLFTGTGYFFYSGVANFGDWAAVIAGLQPHWLWRLGLVVIGAASYYASMLLVRAKMLPFREPDPASRRIRALCWIPYVSEGILAGVSGLLNPLGLFYVFSAALSSSLGANAGLLALPGMMRVGPGSEPKSGPIAHISPVAPIRRSIAWIVTGAIASLVFIFVLGRGLTWSR
jgi:hypothetical protein